MTRDGTWAPDLAGAPGKPVAARLDGLHGFAAAMGLSAREHAVLLCVIDGLMIPEMAERLECRASTVKTYIQRIFDKTGRGSQVELLGLVVQWLMASETVRSRLGAVTVLR